MFLRARGKSCWDLRSNEEVEGVRHWLSIRGGHQYEDGAPAALSKCEQSPPSSQLPRVALGLPVCGAGGRALDLVGVAGSCGGFCVSPG